MNRVYWRSCSLALCHQASRWFLVRVRARAATAAARACACGTLLPLGKWPRSLGFAELGDLGIYCDRTTPMFCALRHFPRRTRPRLTQKQGGTAKTDFRKPNAIPRPNSPEKTNCEDEFTKTNSPKPSSLPQPISSRRQTAMTKYDESLKPRLLLLKSVETTWAISPP